MPDHSDAAVADAQSESGPPAGSSSVLVAEDAAAGFGAYVQNLAVHDWVALGFLALAPLALALSGPLMGERQRMVTNHVILWCFVAGAVYVGRSGTGPRSWFAGIYYRIGLASAMSVTYVLFGESLPLLSSRELDLPLYHLDLELFGFEPAVLMERWATPLTVDWFSFFYLCYFALLAFFLMPLVFVGKSKRLAAELAFTVLVGYGIGQTLYVLVPGYGPLRALREAFHHELPGGPIFRGMHAFVSDAGAKKDIFPSLHTAIPTSFTLLGFRYRRDVGRAWMLVAFITMNTVIATMFLRWHYLIDVFAGLLLAFGVVTASERVVAWEFARRERRGLPELWPSWPSRRAS